MRLTCPNCGAQYEVPDEVIPESGRDVQCSNCGDTWFQHHPDHAPAPAEASPEKDPHGWSEPGPEPSPEPAATATGNDDEHHDPPQAPPRRELDPDVSSVLREEADREKQAREAEGRGGLETQTDLGLDEKSDNGERRSREARERMSRLRGTGEGDNEQAVASGPQPQTGRGSRRNMLPDIDELNSSLSSEPAGTAGAGKTSGAYNGPDDPEDRSSFRLGFMLVVLIVVLLVMAYVFAGEIAGTLPPARPLLAQYVAVVNEGRIWLDTQATTVMQWLEGFTANLGG